jgi:hypothetical protein
MIRKRFENHRPGTFSHSLQNPDTGPVSSLLSATLLPQSSRTSVLLLNVLSSVWPQAFAHVVPFARNILVLPSPSFSSPNSHLIFRASVLSSAVPRLDQALLQVSNLVSLVTWSQVVICSVPVSHTRMQAPLYSGSLQKVWSSVGAQ